MDDKQPDWFRQIIDCPLRIETSGTHIQVTGNIGTASELLSFRQYRLQDTKGRNLECDGMTY